MVKFIQVRPEEIDNSSEGHRGRVSYPIIKGFLETGFYISELDLTGIQQKPALLTMLLRQYAINHRHPVKAFMRRGKVYLMRLDVDEEGNKVENWEQELVKEHVGLVESAQEITAEEVSSRFNREKGNTTK